MIDNKFFCFDLKDNSTLYLIKGKYIKSIHSINDCIFNEMPKNGDFINKIINLNNEAIPVINIRKWLDINNPSNPTSVVLINTENKKYCFEINKIYGLFDFDEKRIFSNNGIKKINFITYLEKNMVCSINVDYLLNNLNNLK